MSKSTAETVKAVATENGIAQAMVSNSTATVEALSKKDEVSTKAAEKSQTQLLAAKDVEKQLAVQVAELKAENARLKEEQPQVIIEKGETTIKKIRRETVNRYSSWDGPCYTTSVEEVPVETTNIRTVGLDKAEEVIRKEVRKEFKAVEKENEKLQDAVDKVVKENKSLVETHKAELADVKLKYELKKAEIERSFKNDRERVEAGVQDKIAAYRRDYLKRTAEARAKYLDLMANVEEELAGIRTRVRRFQNNFLVKLFGLGKVFNVDTYTFA